jgi:hypothetical protein
MVGLWNSGEIETLLDEVGPEFVFTPDPTFPDAGIYKGEALRDWMCDWVRTWKDNRFELLDYTEIGDASLVRSRWHLAAPDSGEGVPVQDFTIIVCGTVLIRIGRAGWRRSSSTRRRSRRSVRELADSPVNRCMLFEIRLGCLKKPT